MTKDHFSHFSNHALSWLHHVPHSWTHSYLFLTWFFQLFPAFIITKNIVSYISLCKEDSWQVQILHNN
jgi:hypothetical protein